MPDDPNAAFPKPQWAPIQDVENVDLTGKRQDGGVDLLIVASQLLDDAADTLNRIRRKVAYYLDVIDLPEFQADMEFPPRDQTTIILSCDYPIHPLAATVIAECQASAGQRGVRLVVQQKTDETDERAP
jgi:hypothetical protein